MPSLQVAKTATSRSELQFKDATIHSIGIAGLLVVRAPEMIRTVLGSCIGVALHDPSTKIGGLAHVILPDSRNGSGDPAKFADTAVDMLVEMLAAEGAKPARIVAKIVGGAAMFGNQKGWEIGDRNAEAVKVRLAHHNIRLLAEAVGGNKGRKMVLDSASGMIQVQIIGATPKVI
jgi:chemotaxis protein CheD